MKTDYDKDINGIYTPKYKWMYTVINNSFSLELFYGFMRLPIYIKGKYQISRKDMI